MKKETKINVLSVLYAAFLMLLVLGFTWWFNAVHGDKTLACALVGIHGLSLGLYLVIVGKDGRLPLVLVPLDAILLFLLLQWTLSAVYWSPLLFLVLNALIVKCFAKDETKFSVFDSVLSSTMCYAMGYFWSFVVNFIVT